MSVRIFEVGPRDGLQNEKKIVKTAAKVKFIHKLKAAGIRDIEVGAFVRKERVKQMADSAQVFKKLAPNAEEIFHTWCLVPNSKGLDAALAAGVKAIAIFSAASNTFNLKNIGMTIDQSLDQYRPLVARAKEAGCVVRGYVSTVFGCPFEGKITPTQALQVLDKVSALGVDQLSIGDTIGVATPFDVEQVVGPALRSFGDRRTAVHFHDTRGTALANALKSLELGVTTFDSSAGGLGGCPYAPGATGNLATEDLTYMLQGMGINTGIDLAALCEASLWLAKTMGKKTIPSRYLQAYVAKPASKKR